MTSENEKMVKKPSERIYYVDPNDVYGSSNGIPLTPDYSDLCISFDLQVETVPRTGFVSGKKTESVDGKKNGVTQTFHFFWTSYAANAGEKENYVSFTRGEEYLDRSYLTTYYTDINFNDFKDKDIVEGLGVESVNISFESYYMPTIKMRFVDVRGATLFGREEAIHTGNRITQDNIWGCFFTFPYPKFRLQVKGFFGHAVTYQLTCLDFKANFDSKTGNFVIDVTFLGYDFGVMSDIPTAYLIAAPYSPYVGMDYWSTHCATDPTWRLTDNNPPKTLREIREKIKAAIKIVSKKDESFNSNDNDGSKFVDSAQQRVAIKEINEAYENVIKCVTEKNEQSGRRLEYLYSVEYEGKQYLLFHAMNNLWWKRIVEKTAVFYNKVNAFKANFPEDTSALNESELLFGRIITKDEPIGENKPEGTKNWYWFEFNPESAFVYPKTNLRNDNEATNVIADNDYNNMFTNAIAKKNEWDTKKIKNIKEYILDKSTGGYAVSELESSSKMSHLGASGGYQIIPLVNTTKILLDLSSRFESSVNEENDNSVVEQDETEIEKMKFDIYESAGLLPTIENVFKTIMCHLETFMAMVYKCSEVINAQITDGKRTPDKLGIKGYTFQDYKSGENSDNATISVPPWVAVSIEEEKTNNAAGFIEHDYVHTIGWVGDFDGETEWEEAKLINGLALGWFIASPQPEAIKESYTGNATIMCLPTDVYADVFPSIATNNPSSLGQYLGTRAAAMFGVIGYGKESAEALGKADAINLLNKIGVDNIRKNFTDTPGTTWKTELNKAPTSTYSDEDAIQGTVTRIYAVNPGCEGKKASIFTEKNTPAGKYRYCYTEYVSQNGKYGMVYVPEADENSTIGNEQAVFIKKEQSNDKRKVLKANLKYKSTLDKNVCKTGRIYYKSSTDKFLDVNSDNQQGSNCSDTFRDEAMFNVYGGTINSLSYDYAEKIVKNALTLSDEKIVVKEYEDSDKTWRDELKKYWHVEDVEPYVIDGIDEEKYCWTIIDGNNNMPSAEPTFIFHSKQYYMQNDDSYSSIQGVTEDMVFAREAAKCILVLSSAGYDIEKVVKQFDKSKKTSVFSSIPYGAVLLVGGLIWRSMQTRDCIRWEHVNISNAIAQGNEFKVNSTLTKKKIDKEAYVLTNTRLYDGQQCFRLSSDDFDVNVRNCLVEEFKNYVSSKDNGNGWQKLKEDFELREKWDNGGSIESEDYVSRFTEFNSTEEGKAKIANERERAKNNSNFANLTRYVVVSYGTMNEPDDVNTAVEFDKSLWDSYSDAFCAKLEEIANFKKPENSAIPTRERNKDTDLKCAMYMYVKRLWDRWFMMASPEKFKVANYMQNFIFMDSFYRNIGSMLHVNCEILYEALADVRGESMLYQLISNITTKHNCHFFAFPDFFGFGDDNNEQANSKMNNLSPTQKIQDMFKPIPFSRKEAIETSNKYIVMLIYDQSENIADFNDYANDDFDIYAYNNPDYICPETFNVPSISSELLRDDVTSEERRVKRYGYNIPSFGVTFGRQNNHLFKNVNVGMNNPIATEQSINALSIVAERGGGNDKAICFYGQDIYPLYNGYSYDCTVEMMGNVQIMPLMYFQLLNMPMFRGTYMIYSVTHSMRPGDMTTTFKGMKLSKFALPFAKGWATDSRLYVNSNGTLVARDYIDECNSYGNAEYKMKTGEKEMLISNNRGITRNPNVDTYEMLESWQTSVRIHVHTDQFTPDPSAPGGRIQGEKWITIKINKALEEDIKQIFDAIYNTKINGKYFVVKSAVGYNDQPNKRRMVNNGDPNQTKLSYHAYGAAIDINAVYDESKHYYNPLGYPDGKADDEYRLRTDEHPVVKIFKNQDPNHKHKYTWGWGGDWKKDKKDYMHFSIFGGG